MEARRAEKRKKTRKKKNELDAKKWNDRKCDEHSRQQERKTERKWMKRNSFLTTNNNGMEIETEDGYPELSTKQKIKLQKLNEHHWMRESHIHTVSSTEVEIRLFVCQILALGTVLKKKTKWKSVVGWFYIAVDKTSLCSCLCKMRVHDRTLIRIC